MISYMFRDMLDEGLIAFVDDMMVYAATEEQHDRIFLETLRRLRDNQLCMPPISANGKATGRVSWIHVLGDSVEMTDDKIEAVQYMQFLLRHKNSH